MKQPALSQRISDCTLAAGLTLATATQLRSESAPIGPGELLLALWMAGALAGIARGAPLRFDRTRAAVLCYWAAALSALGLGAAQAPDLGFQTGMVVRDAFAFIFLGSLCLIFIVRADAEAQARRVVPLLIAFLVVPPLLLLAYSRVSSSIGGVNLFYSIRFRGWARNPNQMAMSVSLIPALVGIVAPAARTPLARGWYLFLVAGALAIGVATLSDALTLCWSMSLAAAAGLLWLQALRRPGRGRARLAAAALVVPLAAAYLLIAVGIPLYRDATSKVEAVYSEGNQGSVRILLWTNGARAAAHSPLVGNGPGPHSGLAGPFGGLESHNTYVDWGASTGLVGLVAVLGLLGAIGLRAWRAGRPAVLVAFVGAIAFSLFHYVLRHPLFWFYFMCMWTFAGTELGARRPRAPAAALPAPRAPVGV